MDERDRELLAACQDCIDGDCADCAGRTAWCPHQCGWLQPPAEETR